MAECIASLFPGAEIFTLIASEAGTPEGLAGRQVHTSFLQKIPFARRYHRHMMPLYPNAVEGLDLRGFDLVLSSDSGPAKGVRLDPGTLHICYCHSPMRYLYDGYDAYRSQMGAFTKIIFAATARRVREWDLRAAERVTAFIANSEYVAGRILRFYGRNSEVIRPPIDLHRARTVAVPGDHYLCAGRLVGYKRTDLMMEACQRLGRTLRIVGTGPEEANLRKRAGSNAVFLGEVSTEALWQEYAECKALLFAADEDFGMVPLEAQACGRPVIAYGVGGSLETVRGEGVRRTGVYFPEQTVESVMAGILEFEAVQASFDPRVIQSWAAEFDTQVFLQKIRSFVLARVPEAATVMASSDSLQPTGV